MREFRADGMEIVLVSKRVAVVAFGGEDRTLAERIGPKRRQRTLLAANRRRQIGRIVDAYECEAFDREADGRAVKIETLLLEGPTHGGDPFRISSRALLEAADAEQQVLEGIARELFEQSLFADSWMAEPVQ